MNVLALVGSELAVSVYLSTAVSLATTATHRYVPRGRNELYSDFEQRFAHSWNQQPPDSGKH
jgi:hypothetical protein